MKNYRLFIAIFFMVASFKCVAQNYTAQVLAYIKVNDPVVAITNVKLIDGTGKAAKLNQTIIINKGKIEQVGDAGKVKLPDGVKTIDGTGKTIIPGLVM